MAAYILDTSIVSLIQRNHPRTTEAVVAHTADTLGVATVEETLGGWYSYIRKAKTRAQEIQAAEFLAEAVTVLGQFRIVPPTDAAFDIFDRLVRLKRNIGKNDLRIASIALDLGAVVVTNNVQDFIRVPNLVIEDWSAQ